MCLLPLRGCSWPHWATGSLVVLLGVALLSPAPPGGPIDTRDWTLAQLLEHLKRRGIQLHLVPAPPGDGGLTAYLSEDPDTTWASVQHRPVFVEYIHQWRGTVRVGRTLPDTDEEGQLAMWGVYGCRIGAFTLFGDERLIERLEAACRR